MKRPRESYVALRVIGALAISLALWSPRAWAGLKVSVGNPGLEHFDSDGGVQLDFGLTDQSGAPVGNLRPDDVKVFEDGKEAKILDFRGVGQDRPVDIVFVMDVTESMQPYIDAVKLNIVAFARDLARNNRGDYRLGLVTFEDYVVSKYKDCGCAYRNKMTSDVREFIEWVGTLRSGGGGDIPENQLAALAYASSFPFRPEAEGIIILITDAPPHHDGDGSASTEHDQAYWDHRGGREQVTDLTGAKVATMLRKNGLTLYAVAPPPFIAPEYAETVKATHGRLYNIVTEQGRFPSLVREIGRSIATEYSLTYRTPRPIEDGTNRSVELRINYEGNNAVAATSYQVRGVGGAVINIPEDGGAGLASSRLSFGWWNAAVPLAALLGLLGLSRMRFGLSTDEIEAIVAAQAVSATQAARTAGSTPPRAGIAPGRPRAPSSRAAPAVAGVAGAARLVTVDPVDPVPAAFSLLKDEVTIGRGEGNDIVIPHASISRVHARLVRSGAGYELIDLNSTNGCFVDEQPVAGSAIAVNGSQLRLGEVRFVLRF